MNASSTCGIRLSPHMKVAGYSVFTACAAIADDVSNLCDTVAQICSMAFFVFSQRIKFPCLEVVHCSKY